MSQTKATHPEFVEIDLATVHEKMRTILAPAVAGLIVVGLAIWTYLPTLHLFVYRWTTEPDYVHGYLVIPFAAVLLWSRRETLLASPTWRAAATPSWWGLLPLAAWAVLVWLAAWFSSEQLIGLSLVPLLWGIALLAGGWDVLRWSWSAAAFLVFMIPLPRPAADWLSEPLRQVATSSSVFIIQTLGLAAHADGTRITLPTGELGVVDACSGIRMLMLFFAVCAGAALLLETKPWEKVIIVISAIPIAIIANVLRIAVTAALHETAGPELANRVFHDLAGWFMMPMAIVMLAGELSLIKSLLRTDDAGPVPARDHKLPQQQARQPR